MATDSARGTELLLDGAGDSTEAEWPSTLPSEVFGREAEPAWDALVRIAACLMDAPIAGITWCEGEVLRIKAAVGVPYDQTPLARVVCSRTIARNETVVIADLGDSFPDYGDSARSYAGVPIRWPGTNQPVGTVFVMDPSVRSYAPHKLDALEDVARQAEALLLVRCEKHALEVQQREQVFARAKLQAQFDGAGVGIFAMGRTGDAYYGNPALERILGHTMAALTPGWRELVHPDDRALVAEWERDHASDVQPRSVEYRFARTPDEYVWLRSNIAPFSDGGEVTGWVGTSIDISEQKALETRLRTAEARLEIAVAVAEHAIWEWNIDPRKVLFTAAWHRLFEIDSADSRTMWVAWKARVHPDDIANVMQLRRVHLSGNVEHYQAEYRFRRGTEWRWIFERGRVVARTDAGKVARIVGICVDMTQQRQIEDELRSAAERLTQSESIAGLGHWVYSSDTRRFDCSPNLFRIFQREPTLGVPRIDETRVMFEGDDFEDLRRKVREAVAEQRPWSIEYSVRRADGTRGHMHARGRALIDRNGALRYEGTEQDVTEVVRAREALQLAKEEAELASRAKADFLATMSHEIRTPLNGVLGMAEFLAETPLSSEQRTFVDMARASGQWLLALVSDVLDFSKIDAEQVELAPRLFAVRELLDEVTSVVADAAQRKGIELWVEVDAAGQRECALIGDAQRIRQIALNLVANAVKFTERGEVEVHASVVAEDDHARLMVRVRDTGPGIAPTQLEQVFKPFVQGGTSPTRLVGTGLGLAIAQRLARHMGGHIDVRSEVGVGSTFELTLRLPFGQPERASTLPGDVSVVVLARPGVSIDALSRDLVAAGVKVRSRLDGDPPTLILIDGDIAAAQVARSRSEAPLVLLTTIHTHVPPGVFAAHLVKPVGRRALLELIAQLAGDVSGPRRPRLPRRFDGARVVVAEDNDVNAYLLRKLLERSGCRVEVVNNGASAIAVVTDTEPDIVFMDCIMPGIDGYVATRVIRASGLDVPIIAVTASAIDGDRDRCLEAGMNDYLTKPITSEGIAAALARWVRA